MLTLISDTVISESAIKPSDCQITGFYAETTTGVNAIYYCDGKLYYFGKYTNIPHLVECPEILDRHEKTLEVMTQCPDLSVSERDQIVETLITKQQCPDLSVDTTATRFIDSDPDSDLSCDLYQIVFPDSYVTWLNSGLSRSEFVEKTYYAS